MARLLGHIVLRVIFGTPHSWTRPTRTPYVGYMKIGQNFLDSTYVLDLLDIQYYFDLCDDCLEYNFLLRNG